MVSLPIVTLEEKLRPRMVGENSDKYQMRMGKDKLEGMRGLLNVIQQLQAKNDTNMYCSHVLSNIRHPASHLPSKK